MAFNRTTTLSDLPDHATLTQMMVGIGMNFAAQDRGDLEISAERASSDHIHTAHTESAHTDIELTLLYASQIGVEGLDFRVLSILTTWIGIHHKHINADRLIREARELTAVRSRAYWSAIGGWLSKDRRFKRLISLHEGSPIELLAVGTAFQIARRGEDERFKGSALLVPRGTLRERASDVLTPTALAQRHSIYRSRVHMGPSWRADVWSALERDPETSISSLARQVGCSFGTAWQVAQDFYLMWR